MTKSRQSANLISENNIFSDITNNRVGIATTIPQYTLDVKGDINFSGSLNQGGSTFVASRWTSGTGNDIYRLNGDVGIGTTNPTSVLQVVGDTLVSGVVTATTFRGNIVGVSATFTGNVSVAGTLTYEDVTNVDSVGLVTARAGAHVATSSGNLLVGTTSPTGTASQPLQVTGGVYVSGSVGIGTTRPTSTFQVVGGDSDFEGVIETVGTATTYMVGSGMVLEMDVRRATVYTYTMPTGANIGIVSFKNMPAQTGSATGSTVTLLVTQNSAGTGNTTAATGIGTNCTVVGYENGASVAGISTRGLVGSATTVTLSTTGSDVDFVSFFINYTGATNTAAASYKVYVTKNGGFRRGNVGV